MVVMVFALMELVDAAFGGQSVVGINNIGVEYGGGGWGGGGGGEDEEKVNAVGRAMLPFAVVIEVVRHWSDISGS
jgi:hypothetical protein